MSVSIKSADDIEGMRLAGRLASEVLDHISPKIVAGITTRQIDAWVHDYIVNTQKCIPATLGYQPGNYPPYPASCCTSVNHVICHGIPGDKKLKNGDIINVDITVISNGYHGDTSRMFIIGEAGIMAKRLVSTTYQAMWRGINTVKPGASLGDIGHAIESFVKTEGFSVVQEYCGHGIGKQFHEEPQVMHFGKPGTGLKLLPGMIFTIEPMINAGKAGSRLLADGWTVVTADHSLSAQWEHTVLVTDTGFEVLTLSAGSPAAASA
jgi:methionyl aminopeptidase